MDKKEVEDFFFIVDELEETESELRATNMKITKTVSDLKKETKKHKIVRLEKRIDTYNDKYEILHDISCDLFEDLDDYCNHLAGYIMNEFEEEFIKKMLDRFVISEFIQKIDLIIEQLKKKRSEELNDKEKKQINERLQYLFIVRNCLNRKSDSCALRIMLNNIKDYFKRFSRLLNIFEFIFVEYKF